MSLFLNFNDIENICYEFTKAHLTYDEPIPSFSTRYPGNLESALFSPGRMLNGQLVYENLNEQAAVLFYEMIKMHPFFNGNKRIACVTLMTFLLLNSKWLETGWENLYLTAIGVAESEAKNRREILNDLQFFINKFVVSYKGKYKINK